MLALNCRVETNSKGRIKERGTQYQREIHEIHGGNWEKSGGELRAIYMEIGRAKLVSVKDTAGSPNYIELIKNG